jgi:glutathione S-transferase
MEHGDFRLYESQAILRYLDRTLPGPALTPAHPQAAGRMDQLMNINDWYLFQGVANIIAFQRIVGPRLMGLTPDETTIAAAMPKARTCSTHSRGSWTRSGFLWVTRSVSPMCC